MKADWLVVGAGFTGCTIAERLAETLGQRVVVVERRSHVGGNAYDYVDEHGVLVHRYGPHIFHTNSERVWSYLSRFTEWHPYEHKVLAKVDGKTVPVPFNLNSLHALFPRHEADALESALLARFGLEAKVPILKLREEGGALGELAEFVYEKVFYGYTVKQWELTPEQLSPSVTGRVPVFISRDDRYFQDVHQGIPQDGYSAMFERMLDHPNIEVLLETSLEDVPSDLRYDRMVYTGAVDEFFHYEDGELPYRSLKFDWVHSDQDRFQETAQINYPNDQDYTRITEFKQLTGQEVAGTTVAVEYPIRHVAGETVPYYPIPRDQNRVMHARYLRRVRAHEGGVYFAGRLADYKYYNMDQAVARALSVSDRIANVGIPVGSKTA